MHSSEYSVPVPSDRQAILCLHCGKPQEVGRKAMSVTCKFCSKSLKLEDVKITRYEARRVIETCGTVTIDKKGHVVSDVRAPQAEAGPEGRHCLSGRPRQARTDRGG